MLVFVLGLFNLFIMGIAMIAILEEQRGNTNRGRIVLIIDFALIFVIVANISTSVKSEQVEEQYRELISLKAGTRQEGKEFLITYSYLEKDVYSYYYRTENGGYKRENIKDSNVTIFEEDNCTPRITKVITTYFTQYEMFGIKSTGSNEQEEEYNIYVPKGSIVREFKLDAE